MGVFLRGATFIVRGALAAALGAGVLGCQNAWPTVSNRALVAHWPGVNFSGLRPMTGVKRVNVSCSLPRKWIALQCQSNLLYTNQQWKAPSGYTGLGIIYAHLPFPLSAQTLLWFARLEYSRNGATGQALAQWTDSLGRPWFEAQNDKYHVRGYAVTDGASAWIVYFGYKTTRPANISELNLASHSVDTVLPHFAEPVPSGPVIANGRPKTPEAKG